MSGSLTSHPHLLLISILFGVRSLHPSLSTTTPSNTLSRARWLLATVLLSTTAAARTLSTAPHDRLLQILLHNSDTSGAFFLFDELHIAVTP